MIKIAQILEEIKQIEKKMERGLEQARKDKEQMISNADAEAVSLIADEKDKVDEEMKRRVSIKEKELKNEKESVEIKGRKLTSEVNAKAQAGKSKAVDFVIEQFEKKVD